MSGGSEQPPLLAALARARSAGRAQPQDATPTADGLLTAFLQAVAETNRSLYSAQEEALLALAAGSHVILATPTGSGKSLVAEFHHFLSFGQGRRSWYTSPIKALVHEKFFALCRQFGSEQVGLLTGDAAINRDAPIVCATAEVLANVCLGVDAGELAHDIVMDEFHYYGDPGRGTAWQLPLLMLPKSQCLLMSATLGDITTIRQHLAASSAREVAYVHSTERPVPLDYAYSEVPLHEQLSLLLAKGGAPIYVVYFSQREAIEAAQATMSIELASRSEKAALKERIGALRFDSPFGPIVRRLLLHGIGLHHAGLLPKYRLLCEQLAQDGLLKIIMGTDTLGVGINVPIRTVIFSKLCKFDGSKVGLLSVRDFRQIAGRAGRKGFDDRGSVIAQAPEHVIENRRLESRVLSDAKKLRKLVKKKPPTHNFVPWDATTFAKLQAQPAETVRSQFRLSYHLLCTLLHSQPNGLRTLHRVISLCHESPAKKKLLRTEARRMVQTLQQAGVCHVLRTDNGRHLALNAELGQDFSLTRALALFVLATLPALDAEGDAYPLEALALIESVLESPAAILRQEIAKRKDEANKAMKAEGKSFEERIAELDAIEHDKPLAEFIYPAFNAWVAHNPWAADVQIRPKGIARHLIEEGLSFAAFVKAYRLERYEGVLLRYLMQVEQALRDCVPNLREQDGLLAIATYLRSLIAHTDASLLEAWEVLGTGRPQPVLPALAATAAAPENAAAAWRADPKGALARIRGDLHRAVAALADADWPVAASCFAWPEETTLEAGAAELAEQTGRVCQELGPLLRTPLLRQARLTQVEPRADGSLVVVQTLLFAAEEAEGELLGFIEPSVDFTAASPLIRLTSIEGVSLSMPGAALSPDTV